MNTIYLILGILLVLVGLLFIFVSTQPDKFVVQRVGEFKASPAKIFPYINRLKNWNDWSPWAKMDPDCKYEFAGPPEGVGSVEKWNGNNKVGQGQLTIIESEADKHVGMKLEFTRPFVCQNKVNFDLSSEGESTKLIWSMHGENNFVGKVMCLFMNMDKMVGADFENGLANLKELVEK